MIGSGLKYIPLTMCDQQLLENIQKIVRTAITEELRPLINDVNKLVENLTILQIVTNVGGEKLEDLEKIKELSENMARNIMNINRKIDLNAVCTSDPDVPNNKKKVSNEASSMKRHITMTIRKYIENNTILSVLEDVLTMESYQIIEAMYMDMDATDLKEEILKKRNASKKNISEEEALAIIKRDEINNALTDEEKQKLFDYSKTVTQKKPASKKSLASSATKKKSKIPKIRISSDEDE